MNRITLLAVLAVGGCKGKNDGAWKPLVTELESYRDKMCACKSKDAKELGPCVVAVDDAKLDLSVRMANTSGRDGKPSDELWAEVKRLAKRWMGAGTRP
jgi:hypothetical protein